LPTGQFPAARKNRQCDYEMQEKCRSQGSPTTTNRCRLTIRKAQTLKLLAQTLND
jgi:hypothetical protein